MRASWRGELFGWKISEDSILGGHTLDNVKDTFQNMNLRTNSHISTLRWSEYIRIYKYPWQLNWFMVIGLEKMTEKRLHGLL